MPPLGVVHSVPCTDFTALRGGFVSVTAELDPESGKIWINSGWRWKDIISTLPGAKWSTDKTMWYIPVSWSACLAIRNTFKGELDIGPKLFNWASDQREEWIDACTDIREATEWPANPDGSDAHLYWWQRAGAEFIRTGKRVLILDDPGAGKTLTTITGMQKLYIQGEKIFPIIVVGPSSMKKTWKREFEQWWPGIDVQVVSGGPVKRKKQLATPAHVYVMNFEAIRGHSRLAPYGSIALKKCVEHKGEDPKVTPAKCEVHIKELNKMEFGSAIIDEIHRCKDAKSVQSRALLSALGDTPIRVGLTGTPIANNVVDLWSLFHLLDPKEFASKTRWIDRFVETMPNPFGGMVVIGVKAERRAEFDAVHNPRMRRMTEDQVLDFLPPIIYERRDCEMSPKQASAYKSMKTEMIAKLEDSGTVVTTSPMTQAARLLQFASSYCEVETTEVIDEHGFSKISQKTTLVDPSAKLDVFMEDVENRFGDHQVAVMAVSRQLLELLSRRLDKAGVKHGMITGTTSEDARQWYMDEFQAGRLKYILFTTGAGGTGITLTAARYLARPQIPFSLVEYIQSLRRVRRIGSERHPNIMVLDYVTTDTADEGVFEAVFKKEMNFQDIVKDNEALKRFLKE